MESPAGRQRAPSSAWREARDLVWSHRRRLLLGLGLLAVGRVAALVLPASSKYLVDEVVGKGRGELLAPLALGIVGAALVQAGTSFWLSQVIGVAAQREIMQMRRRLHGHVVRLPIAYFDSTRSGVLISRIINDPDGLRNLLGNGLVQLLSSLLTGALALMALLYLNWRLTTVTLLLLTAFGALMAFAFTRLRPLFRQRAELNAQLTGGLAESLNGIRVIKAYRAGKREQLGFARRIHRVFRNVAREITLSSAVGAGAILIFSAIAATLFYLGGLAILHRSMTLGDFVMFVFFIGLLIAPVVRLADSATQLGEAFAGLDRVRELRAVAAEADDDHEREPVPDVRGEVEFDAVSFEYSPGVPVLRDVSFCARPGQTVALVGPSGAGKTTLIGLVMGFHRPQSGQLRIDGRDLSRLRIDEYRAHLGVVLQESFLFDGSIADNIAFSRPRASREEIERAGRLAHCDEIARRLEGGYDTVVGERGVRLSGGERQRVAIARAVLADPRILILDEATSSLDSESEALVQDGLRALRRGRTTLVIAHRLSTIRSADEILVLDGGRIVERGSHDELLARRGRYLELHERQHRGAWGPPAETAAKAAPGEAAAAAHPFGALLGRITSGGL
ncbi:MAG TPA: ABC transporter ATP-binding protein [Vicinamibacteria bacterium]|nr:ABC transporter ATP-binding protein [Vicinamibacteria bacterium]